MAKDEKKSFEEKDRYRRLKAAGICTACGKAKATEGHTLCEGCKERKRINSKRWREKNPRKKKSSGQGAWKSAWKETIRAEKFVPKEAPESENVKQWLVSDKTCAGCKYYGWLGSMSKRGVRMCEYTWLTGRMKEEPCATCDVKVIGKRRTAMDAARGIK